MKTSHKTKNSFNQAEARTLTLGDSGKRKSPHQPENPIIASDDRLGPDEALDEANVHEGEAPGTAAGAEEVLTSDHRVRKIEPGDEHNTENLMEEGLQGYMHDSLTKPRK